MIKKTYLQSAMDFANTLEPRFCIGDLDLPERRKRGIPVAGRRMISLVLSVSYSVYYLEAQVCPRDEAIRSSSHIVGE